MDRAHRLGQRRTVNVYRILTRGTLEERVLGLQQFKKDVAEAGACRTASERASERACWSAGEGGRAGAGRRERRVRLASGHNGRVLCLERAGVRAIHFCEDSLRTMGWARVAPNAPGMASRPAGPR